MWRHRSPQALALLLAVACVDSEPTPKTSAEIWCEGLCVPMVRCGLEFQREQCENNCVAERPGLVMYSVAGAEALAPCVARLSCDALRSEAEWYAELDVCWEAAQERVTISPNARTLCVDYAAAWFECGAWWTVEECEKNYSMWNNEIIDSTFACIDAPDCSSLSGCNDAAFGTP
jgi:hypothetical protein